MKQKKQDVLLGDSKDDHKSTIKRNESRNETTGKRNDTTNDRKRKSETKNQAHNKKAKTLEADKNVSYEKAKGKIQNDSHQ